MSDYCYDYDRYPCRCESDLEDIINDLNCRLKKLEKLLCNRPRENCTEIITSVEMPFSIDGTVDGAVFTASGDLGYTVYACQPRLNTPNLYNNPYDIMYNSWGEPTTNNGTVGSNIVTLPLGSTTPIVSNSPLIRSLNGITELILENITITRPVIGADPIPEFVDTIIGRVPPIARPVENRTVVLYNRTDDTNRLGFPDDPATNSIGNIVNRIVLIIATTGRIILRIIFRSPQVPPIQSQYSSSRNISISYSMMHHSTVIV